jgi:hypothetical protein
MRKPTDAAKGGSGQQRQVRDRRRLDDLARRIAKARSKRLLRLAMEMQKP